MRRSVFWSLIGAALVGLAAAAGAATVYFYDAARADRLANGVVIAGVDVGGLRTATAEARLRRALLPRLREPVTLLLGGNRFTLGPERAGLAVDVDGMVARALAASRRGDILHRFWREVHNRPLNLSVPLAASYSQASVAGFVRHVGRVLDQPARSATVVPSATALAIVQSHTGRAVRARVLARELGRRLLDLHAGRTLAIPLRPVRPGVTTTELARRYPSYITVDRESFQLRLFRDLRLYKTYRIAVGRAGLETPAGLYRIYDKQVNPSWHVPDSAWAGALAGRVIPPGPADPIKARWMGFYNGAGIHGTDDLASLGTAASHGCIRMSIPDVEQLYNLVPYGTPIYVD